jgi:hypothetical protein
MPMCGRVSVRTGLLAAALAFQQGLAPGRWVNLDATDVQLVVLHKEADGTVHQLIPAPQFSATYRVVAGRLVIKTSDRATDSSLALQGDTLLVNGNTALVRISRIPAQSTPVAGTWRPIGAKAGARMDFFMTFRSDSQVVLEVGFPVLASESGDTLRLASSQGSIAFFTVRQTKDTLYLSDGATLRRFVRRAWGCFGNADFDASAVECSQ